MAQDAQGDDYLLSWNGTNRDPLPGVFAGRLLRKDKVAEQARSVGHEAAALCHATLRNGSWCEFRREKTLAEVPYMENPRLVCSSSAQGTPSVSVFLNQTSSSSSSSSSPSTEQQQVTFEYGGPAETSTSDVCISLLRQAYLFVSLMSCWLSGSLPSSLGTYSASVATVFFGAP